MICRKAAGSGWGTVGKESSSSSDDDVIKDGDRGVDPAVIGVVQKLKNRVVTTRYSLRSTHSGGG